MHRSSWNNVVLPVFVVVLLCSHVASSSEQPRLGLGGVGLEVGIAAPEHADLAPQYGGVVHLGSLFKPWLHLSAGISYWSSDIDREPLGSTAQGTISDLAVRADLRWEAGKLFGMYPYIVTGLASHSVSADIPEDRSTERALDGLGWGFDTGFGLTSAAHGLRYGFELRRRFVSDVDGWAATASIGWFFPRSSSRRPDAASGLAASAVTHRPLPVTAPMASALGATELEKLKRLLVDLVRETRAQRAEVDSLRRLVHAAPVPTPAAVSDHAAAQPPPSSRLQALHQSLTRAADLGGQQGAVHETGDSLLLVLPGSLLFGTASSDVQVASRESLRRIALVLLRFSDVVVSVEGHADSRGDPTFNLNLSRERATAVARELADQGVDAERLTVIGLGATVPVADNNTAAGRALNRRVELRFRLPVTGR